MKSIAICLITIFLLNAQDDFEKFKAKENKEFQDYLSKEDQQFIKFLKANWIKVDLEKPIDAYEQPKPIKLPTLSEAPKLKPGGNTLAEIPKLVIPTKTVEIKKPSNYPKPNKIKQPKGIKKTTEIVSVKKVFNFDFYGVTAELPLIEGLSSFSLNKVDNKSIAEFWQHVANSEKDELTSYLSAQQKLNRWSDYEYYTYLYHTSKKIFESANLRRLLTWYFLSKSGYKLKVGYYQDQIYLLIPLKHRIYSVSYFTFPGEQQAYYTFIPEAKDQTLSGGLSTYKQDYPKTAKIFSFFMPESPNLGKDIRSKNLRFSYNNQQHNLKVNYNHNLIAFFNYFPQSDVDLYLKTEASPELATSIMQQLRPIIQGKTESEAANIIIRFVQTAFEYQTDPQQFQREKFLFPDETIYYPASDCEDRSILYAYLIRKLLGLKVIGLSYPGHIATAVKFNGSVTGDLITVNGSSYLVCDPTYINANIGMTMPQFKTVKPKVVGL